MLIERGFYFGIGLMCALVLSLIWSERSAILNKYRRFKKQRSKKNIEEECVEVEPLVDDEGLWYVKQRYIAHALGGVGGFTYTNSKEALSLALENGFKIVEGDVSLTRDRKFVLSHDFSELQEQDFEEIPPDLKDFCGSLINYRYTPMTLEEMLLFIKSHKDIYLFIDSKKGILDLLLEYLISLEYIDEISNNLIIQVFTKEELMMVHSKRIFRNIHFNVPSGMRPFEIVPFLVKYQIHTVSMWKGQVENKVMVEELQKANIKIFVYSINRIAEMKDAVSAGVWGCFTDFLLPEELKHVCGEVV